MAFWKLAIRFCMRYAGPECNSDHIYIYIYIQKCIYKYPKKYVYTYVYMLHVSISTFSLKPWFYLFLAFVCRCSTNVPPFLTINLFYLFLFYIPCFTFYPPFLMIYLFVTFVLPFVHSLDYLVHCLCYYLFKLFPPLQIMMISSFIYLYLCCLPFVYRF